MFGMFFLRHSVLLTYFVEAGNVEMDINTKKCYKAKVGTARQICKKAHF